ncbi:MAG: FAD-dependent oxidoreductase [Bacteroidales bacterium]|nr:FAD-dependent oxidoreductase [Bacteroidales bacterium]
MNKFFSFILFTFLSVHFLYSQTIWVEAEQFENKGGWTIDPLFMDQMGSPFLLAHGNGVPVKDATTKVEFSKTGKYTLWVRTRNWNAPWDEKQAPGVFNISINGKKIGQDFGVAPSKWGWVNGGQVDIPEKAITLALHDLTGFDGRCDAIIFSKSKSFVPPAEKVDIEKLRNKLLNLVTKPEGEFDLVVVGAGVAGLTASISAARLGLKVALIHNRPMLGGNNSPEIRVVASGGIKLLPYKNIGNVVAEIGNVYSDHDRVMTIINNEPNISLFTNKNADGVVMDGKRIKTVFATDILTSQKHQFNCKYVADCSGDGAIGVLAGADFMMGREKRSDFNELLAPEVDDNLSLGSTIAWSSRKTDQLQTFPVTPWAVNFTEVTAQYTTKGNNWWETGFRYDQVADFEYIRDYALRVIYGNWSFLKNFSKKNADYANYDLNNVSFVPGKRESRRLVGDVVVTQNVVEGGWKDFYDGCVMVTYSIDQHFPRAENTLYFPGEEFLSYQKHNFNPLGVSRNQLKDEDVNPPYLLPYRSLYSKNIDNLFMAGRNISVTRIALNTTRVQKTTGMMGEVVGLAAALCIEKKCTPRDLYSTHFEMLKNNLLKGVPSRK